ncbi:cytochrome c oxidase subunit II [Aquilutibacter rugosus]|uniref:cytochrome c oxidase subunit II n=1 Tax=Aquilutibacter rugosus TaxID=3115820 RepID=UPI002F3F2274
MIPRRIKHLTGALLALSAPAVAFAQAADPKRWQLNMGRGVTSSSVNAYEAHMLALWICVVIGVVVFGAMFYAMFKFRKSKGAVPDTSLTHSTKLETIWTVVPILLLLVMAFPATDKLIKMYDYRKSEMTVKITGYQWLWKYDYLDNGISFTSRLTAADDALRQSGKDPRTVAGTEHYLLNVDNELVLPAKTKIRFVLTADDVIHAWWVPALGWKQDAVPGIINEAWTYVDEPGVYRGQCAELCGKDHGFMPIVVRVLSKEDYAKWVASKTAKPAEPAAAPAAGAATATVAPAAK